MAVDDPYACLDISHHSFLALLVQSIKVILKIKDFMPQTVVSDERRLL